MFRDDFALTGEAASERSVVSTITSEPFWSDLPAGVYNEGLLTLLDTEGYGPPVLDEWSPVVRPRSVPVGFNAWGDVFLVSFDPEPLASILFLQERSLVDLGPNPFPLFDDLLADARLSASVLSAERFRDVRARLGPLSYGECFVLEPVASLGGDPKNPESYAKGDFRVYLSIAAQS